jgi:hypothetical protein
MTTHTVRRTGAALLTGGLLLVAAYLFYPSTARSDLIRPAAGIGLLGMLIVLPALIAFQAVQSPQSARARTVGWIGVALAAVGWGLLEIPHLVFGLFDPRHLYDLDAYHSGPYGALAFYGGIGLGVGLVLMSVATWRAGVFGRLAAWLLIANVVVSTVTSVLGDLGTTLHAPAPSYVLAAALGFTVLQHSRRIPSAGASASRHAGMATTGRL